MSASSNHAADWYEDYQIHEDRKDMVRPEDFPVSSNFYGWAKASYELLGWPYACGAFGRRLEFVMVRIGHPTPVNAARHMAEAPGMPPAGSGIAELQAQPGVLLQPAGPAATIPQGRSRSEDVSANGEVPFAVVYGISNNTRAFWSLDSARQVLGYEPEDDSEVVYGRGRPPLPDRCRRASAPRAVAWEAQGL